jgi:hypothetical protein
LHRLSSSFVLAYHGCRQSTANGLLAGNPFRLSSNDYDWLGPGVYFWEANPERALDFARDKFARQRAKPEKIAVVGAVIEMGLCLDLTTKSSIDMLRTAYDSLKSTFATEQLELPRNSPDLLRRNLDCAVIRRLHEILSVSGSPAIDTVKGVFVEGSAIYPNAGFHEKTHIQISVRNPTAIKGVFRVPYPKV